MRNPVPTLLVCLLVVGAAIAVPVAGAVSPGAVDGTTNATSNDTAATADSNDTASDSIAPGERLSGAVGVTGATLRGDLDARTFGLRVARAESADAKAEIVAAEVAESRTRAERLDTRLDRLREARRNGTISQGQYAARAAEARAELATVEAIANRSTTISAGLPDDVRRANGVNVTEIRALQRRAAELRGSDVARAARTIADSDGDRVPENATDGGARMGTSSTPPTATPRNRTVSTGERPMTPDESERATTARNRTGTPTTDRSEGPETPGGNTPVANGNATGERESGPESGAGRGNERRGPA